MTRNSEAETHKRAGFAQQVFTNLPAIQCPLFFCAVALRRMNGEPHMAKRLKQLQDRDAAITAQMRKMSDALATEDRAEFTEEETGVFAALKAESTAVQRGLAVENDILAQEKRLASVRDANVTAANTATTVADAAGGDGAALGDKAYPPNIKRSYSLRNFKGGDRTHEEWNKEAYKAGRFFLAACWKDPGSIRWCQQNGLAMNGQEYLAQSEITNNSGGILVPDVLSDVIIDLKEQYGIYAQYSDRWSMTSDNLTIPRRLSGVTAYFVSDGVATTESQMGWDGVTLVAKELAALVRYPITLSEDAIINMADKLAYEIGYAFANKEDLCGFTGDGTQTYGGIRGLSVLIDDSSHGNSVTTNGTVNGGQVVAAAGGTSFGATVLGDYERMVGILPQYAAENACWFFSRAGYAAGPQRLMDAGGGNTNETLAMGGGGSLTKQDKLGRPLRTFLGYPVVIAQVLNSTLSAQASAAGVAFLGDLSLASSYGARREIAVDASKDRYFEFRQIAIQGVQRFDIVNHDLGSTTAAGPVVGLKLSAT